MRTCTQVLGHGLSPVVYQVFKGAWGLYRQKWGNPGGGSRRSGRQGGAPAVPPMATVREILSFSGGERKHIKDALGECHVGLAGELRCVARLDRLLRAPCH